MEKNNTKGYAALTGKMDETAKSELNTKAEALSKKGKAAFNERCVTDYTKLSKLGATQRINKLNAMIEAAAKEFPARAKKGEGAKKVRGTRQDNEFLNSRKMGILQIDPKTMKLVAEHESIQAAHRAAKTAEGKEISDSSICYCANHRKGFKTAGGFRFEFAKNCTVDAKTKVVTVALPETAQPEQPAAQAAAAE